MPTFNGTFEFFYEDNLAEDKTNDLEGKIPERWT